jgi:CRP-like cAMP-binding protein
VSELLDLCADLPLMTFAPDDVLVRQDDPPGRVLVLVSGATVVERDGVEVAQTSVPGAVFGEMSAVLGRPASATVRAASEVRARVVDDPERFFRSRPGAALAVLRVTATRLDGMTQYLADLKDQLAGAEGHLGMVGPILDRLVDHQGPPARPGSARDPEPDSG